MGFRRWGSTGLPGCLTHDGVGFAWSRVLGDEVHGGGEVSRGKAHMAGLGKRAILETDGQSCWAELQYRHPTEGIESVSCGESGRWACALRRGVRFSRAHGSQNQAQARSLD